MSLGVLLASAAAFLVLAYAVLRFMELLPSIADARILIGHTETDSTIQRVRQSAGNRAAFEAIYQERDDPWNSNTPGYRYQQRKYEVILSLLPQRRFAHVLDIGCGLGAMSWRMAARADKVLGLDLAQSAVERASAHYADIPNLTFAQGDIFALPPELDGAFDLILLTDVLYYAPDTSRESYEKVAARVAQLLRPGGICVICNHYFAWVMDIPTRLSNVIHAAFKREKQFGAFQEYWRPFYLVTLLTRGEPGAAPAPSSSRGKKLLAAMTGLALIALVAWIGVRQIGHQVLDAGWAIPMVIAVHLIQLTLSSFAWQCTISGSELSGFGLLRLRLMREAINSLLPVAQIGGLLANIRLLTQRGVSASSAAAGAVLDLWTEALSQSVFIIAGLAILAGLGGNSSLILWLGIGAAGIALGLGLLGLVQRAGLLRMLEDAILRWTGGLPTDSTHGFAAEIHRRMEYRGRLAGASALHLLSWALGSVEVWLILTAMGVKVSLAQSFVIESLGTAIRSLGFIVPAALGVQEGGYILVCGLFGIPPATAVALSMVKRLREILVGVPGLLMWSRAEWKHRFSQGGDK